MYTTGTAFLEALEEAGVHYIFANLGSDHPALIESLAEAKVTGKKLPEVIICPHEFVAISAAQGFAQITGKPQAIIVHVECGTQNLGGGIHNAFKGRVPMLIFAGASPYTQENELKGSRNEFIHWIQDVHDQRGIMRGYSKYDNEIRTGKNVKQLVHRALQIASSEPKGPVYLVGPREVMEEEALPISLDLDLWQPISGAAIAPKEIILLVDQLLAANNPLIVTSYLGRNPESVDLLVQLCDQLAIPVIESIPNTMNFPASNVMHCGYKWNDPGQHPILAQADLIVVFDSDVPWIQAISKPNQEAVIYYIDIDPLKETKPLWYIPSKRFFKADSSIALTQILEELAHRTLFQAPIERRREEITRFHNSWLQEKREKEAFKEGEITPEYLTACVREIMDKNTIVLSETITSFGVVNNHLEIDRPGSYFTSSAGSLGWNGGAALGIKLAAPTQTIINLTGDGCYLFSIPSTVHWIASRYSLPFLTVIYNNNGWKAPKMSTLGVHPQGIAQQNNDFLVNFNPDSKLADVAKATGGAHAVIVDDPARLKDALKLALEKVHQGQSAVLDVRLAKISDGD